MADRKPKTEDENRDELKKDDAPQTMVEGANRQYQDETGGKVFGDLTSSSGSQNNPGQHGRDGGTVDGVDANPAPSEDVISGDRADDSQTDDREMRKESTEMKKL